MSDLRIGLALGGGGARGIYHIAVLEAFDALGIKPYAISGASIGAIMGAAYASGLSGKRIREITLETFTNRDRLLSRLWKLRPKTFASVFNGAGMQLSPQQVLDVFIAEYLPETFEQLEIPLCVLATDFYACSEVDISSGKLVSAVAASIAIPAVFRPVEHEDRVLIDGGVINPVPFDRLPDDCDINIGVDVTGAPNQRGMGELPNSMDAIFGTFQIMMQGITNGKLKRNEPDLLIKPDLNDIRLLDFLRTREILERGDQQHNEIKQQLENLIIRSSHNANTHR